MGYKYANKIENSAKAVGTSLPISTKKSMEISDMIRGKKADTATKMLQEVLDKKRAVPMKKFARGGTGHKKGMGPGRYPEKACKNILSVLKAAIANAQVKGMSNLVINGISAQRGAHAWHYGRQRRRRMKRTHVEIVLTELEKRKESKK